MAGRGSGPKRDTYDDGNPMGSLGPVAREAVKGSVGAQRRVCMRFAGELEEDRASLGAEGEEAHCVGRVFGSGPS